MVIAFTDRENICIDTNLMILPSLVFEILAKVRFSVMAVLICIFFKMPKGARLVLLFSVCPLIHVFTSIRIM